MEKSLIAEIINAIKTGQLIEKDKSEYFSAHSVPFYYEALSGEHYILLRAKDKGFVDGYQKQQVLYPFLQTLNLPVRTARELTVIECENETYAVMERFFGHGHNPGTYSKATGEQQKRFTRQIAEFFYKLHSTPTDILPKGVDFTPYFRYDKNAYEGNDVFLHADFNYSNFHIDDDYNLHAVFDWHPACVGPRIAEFATFVYCNDVDYLPFVLDEYNKIAGTSFTPKEVIDHNTAREWEKYKPKYLT